jgi:hypothetical protein
MYRPGHGWKNLPKDTIYSTGINSNKIPNIYQKTLSLFKINLHKNNCSIFAPVFKILINAR